MDLSKYLQMGLEIGMATGAEMDEALVRQLTDAHRELHGVPKAKVFEVYDSPFAVLAAYAHLPEDQRPVPSNAFFGQHDISWLILALVAEVEYGKQGVLPPVKNLLELTKHVGWFWMDGERTLVSRRPVALRLQQKASGVSVLHSPDQLAMEFKDGTGFYAVDGIRVPDEEVPTLLSKDATRFLMTSNAELRAAFLRTLGGDLVDVLPTTVLDETAVPHVVASEDGVTVKQDLFYRLLEVDLNPKRVYLEMTCPSKGTRHVEAVPPDVRTARQALQWRTWGTLEGSYVPPVVRS